MVFLFAVEWIVLTLFLLGAVTQVLIPMLLGSPLFPAFRWRGANKERISILDLIERERFDQETDQLRDVLDELQKGSQKNDVPSDNNP